MKIREILVEFKKGVKAVKHNKKAKDPTKDFTKAKEKLATVKPMEQRKSKGHDSNVAETATPGATSAGMIGSIENPHISPGPARGKKSYIGSPGKSGTKAPPQPKVTQPKSKYGTAKNALDMKGNIFGGGAIKRK